MPLVPVNSLYGEDRLTEMNDERLVNIEAFIPGIRLDIRYATVNNFTKRPLYPVARCYLRKQVDGAPCQGAAGTSGPGAWAQGV